MRSENDLERFTKFCEDHPDKSFYEALRVWSGFKRLYGQRTGRVVTTAITARGTIIDLEVL